MRVNHAMATDPRVKLGVRGPRTAVIVGASVQGRAE